MAKKKAVKKKRLSRPVRRAIRALRVAMANADISRITKRIVGRWKLKPRRKGDPEHVFEVRRVWPDGSVDIKIGDGPIERSKKNAAMLIDGARNAGALTFMGRGRS